MAEELKGSLVNKVTFAQCKCQAKYLMQQHKEKTGDQIENKAATYTKRVEVDNLYDMLFSDPHTAKTAENLSKKVTVGSNGLLNVLEAGDQFKVEAQEEDLDLNKLKINKQFKLVSSLPKLQTVPATPQFFDMAGGYVTYADPEVEAAKFEVQASMFSAISGFFGGGAQ